MACSLDGRVAGAHREPVHLSSPPDDARVHALRARSDAILVGVNTVLHDDPRLTARTDPPPATQPTRVVLDTHARTPPDANVLDDEAPTILITGPPASSPPDGAAVVPVGDPITPPSALAALQKEGHERILVEGGPTVAASFLQARRIDVFTLYIAPRVLGEGPSLAHALEGLEIDLAPRSSTALGEGTLVSYEVPP